MPHPFAILAALLAVGHGGQPAPEPPAAAEVRILFVGNSHTYMHDLPKLVAAMVKARQPGKSVVTQFVGVNHLEDTAQNPKARDEIAGQAWTAVVLQAQKISTSGRFEYSRAEGLALARQAKDRGAAVVFYPEWGLKGKPGDGVRQEKVYREMAAEAGVKVAPVAKAWDMALAGRPALGLHDADGNHQSPLGAFLTACVLTAAITGESPAPLADFPYKAALPADRRFLADVAAKAVAGEK